MTNMENKNENQTFLFFFPLKVTTYKVESVFPSVEEQNGEWRLTEAEKADLMDYIADQNADCHGESLEQRPIRTQDGEIYVNIWNMEHQELFH